MFGIRFFCTFLLFLLTHQQPVHGIVPNEPEGKFQLIIFEGSDWCSNCRHLERNVISDSMFQSFIKQHHIELVIVDFPQRKKQDETTKKLNKEMAGKYQFDGSFPTIVLSRKDTSLYRRIHYSQKSKTTIMEEIEILMGKML